MKIQLQSLRVINCGPLRDVCIHFATDGDSPTTVLAGANGSGKTTVLELIAALSELLHPDAEKRPLPQILKRTEYAQMNWLVDGETLAVYYGVQPEDAAIAGAFFGRMKTSDSGYGYSAGGGNLEQELRSKLKNQQTKYDMVREKQALDDIGFLVQLLPNEADIVPSILYFPYLRYLLPQIGEQIYKERTAHDWVYRYEVSRSYEGSYDSYLVWLDYAEPERFARVVEFMNTFFDGKTFGMKRRELRAVVTTADGGTHDLPELSSGEQNILIMLLELYRRLLPHSIVLIDEIENSLHPAFQHHIVNRLKQLQEVIPFQLIVTSHSLTILEAFGTQSARILTQF